MTSHTFALNGRTAAASLAVSLGLLVACGGDVPAIGDGTTDGGTADASGSGTGNGNGNGNGNGTGGQGGDSGTSNGGADASVPPVGTDAGGGGGTTCGVCPSGFTCDAASNVCKSAGGIPHFGQVYVILMENTSQSAIVGNTKAPFINALFASDAHTTAYQAVTNPSLPNYIALTSGDTQGITCDCHPGSVGTACSASCNILSNCDCTKAVDHLGKQLDAKSLKWRNYGEDMGTPCNINDSGSYAARHIPFLYYDDVRTNAAYCKDHVVDFTSLAADLGKYDFSFITPNLCNDMHDACTKGNIPNGDDWLKANVPTITSAPGFAKDAVLFIVWDEGGTFASQTVGLIAHSSLTKPKFSSATTYDHYSLLATIEEGLGLPKLGKAASAKVMADLFK